MRPGDLVLLRSLYRGRVRFAFPHRFVAHDGDRLVLYLGIGAHGVWMGRDGDGRYLDRWVRGDDPHPHVWRFHHIVWLVPSDRMHMLGLKWDESWRFVRWYVNLQEPAKRTALGVDTCDLALDVEVDPDGWWRWKDEDDFAEMQALGVLDEGAAAAVRAEGERVVAEQPWPTGWEDWRPDPAWAPLSLPDDWAHA